MPCLAALGFPQKAGLVGWNHILDVDKGIRASSSLHQFKGVLNKVANVLAESLMVVDPISAVQILLFEQVEDGEKLAIIGDQGLTHIVCTLDQLDQSLEGSAHHPIPPSVKSQFDGYDQLGDDGQDFLGPSARQQILDSLDGKEDIRVLGLPQAVEEEGKVVMVVQGLKRHLPADSISTSIMLQCNREVAPVIGLAEG